MRSRRPAPEEVADVARRRLELLSAELAEIRPQGAGPSSHDDADGSGELPAWPSSPGTGRPPEAGHGASEEGWAHRPPGRHAHRSLGRRADAVRWLEDRLPAALQGRTRLSGGHLAVVALTVAAALALTAWWVARADGGVTPVTTVPTVAAQPAAGDPSGPALVGTGSVGTGPAGVGSLPPGSGASSAPGTSTDASPESAESTGSGGSDGSAGSIVVDVTGKVRRPGIATLPAGARVVDAIEAAGGAEHGARLGTLNLARVLSDGEQVVVGLPAPAGVAASAASAPTSGVAVPMVNVNTATESELEALPGVGPVTAAAILDYRTENGPFGSVDALLEVAGIGDATLAKIAPYVTL